MRRVGGPVKNGSVGLIPLLISGDPQKMYCDLTPEDATFYEHLKLEILTDLGVILSFRAKCSGCIVGATDLIS